MLLGGDCLEVLKTLPNNSVDSIVTDPPYGLSFMGKKWDYDVPSIDVWKEAIRVLKPGGHALIACGTRTQHRMVLNVEDAGFEIRDVVCHLYGSGFPKSHNLKGEWEGLGTALKPACEFWTLARKPLEKSLTVAQNVLKHGCGALNIDASRIKLNGEKLFNGGGNNPHFKHSGSGTEQEQFYQSKKPIVENTQGRWPANIILDEESARLLDAQSGPCKTGALTGQPRVENKIYGSAATTLGTPRFYQPDAATGASRFFYCAKASKSERNAGLDEFNCVKLELDSCEESTELAILILKAMFESIKNSSIVLSGENIVATFPKECSSIIKTMIQQIIESKTWSLSTPSLTKDYTKDVVSKTTDGTSRVSFAESLNGSTIAIGILHARAGSVTDVVKAATLKKLLKLSDSSVWQTYSSNHPTVKPLKLMEYLIRLITPSNGVVLDPFMGSGSTGVAAKHLKFSFIGIEREPEYLEIAKRRIKAAIESEDLKTQDEINQMELVING